MHWIDWAIVVAGLVALFYGFIKSQRYVKGVADFLTGGRVAGRYVLCVSSGEAAMGLISLVAVYESYYQSGFAYGFWGSIAAPISILMGLTGYCIYRFRESRAMTMGQFLEMRYSRKFRLFAGVLQSISGIVNYGLFPAVSARFIVYFCDLPLNVEVFGMVFPTFALVMAVFLSVAVFIATRGGQISIMVTDCIQGLLSYPMYIVVVVFILLHFSWFKDMAPSLLDRPQGRSFLNPFDIGQLRDFNLFYVLVGIVGGVLGRMGWSGAQGYNTAAKNAHEQKLAGVLGSWRSGFSSMMYLLLAVVAYAYLNSDRYQGGAHGAVAVRTELAVKAVNDVVAGDHLAPVRKEVLDYLHTGNITPGLQAMLDKTAEIKVKTEFDRVNSQYHNSKESNPAAAAPGKEKADESAASAKQPNRETRMETVRDAIQSVDPSVSQRFQTIYGQMRVPLTLRYILPIGILGLFFATCIFHLISCDTTYLHSWGSIVVQDIILPLRGGRPFTPKQQINLLRLLIALVATFAFLFSYFFGQVDYVLMFFTITGAIWLGGSGPCIVGGLYWKRGTTAGAWTALIAGSGLALTGIFLQKCWVGGIYPWLYDHGLVEGVGVWLERLSYPLEPLVKWRMSGEKFPINSMEIYAITILVSVSLYVIVSLLTCREAFNMDRLLHRGKYHREGKVLEVPPLTIRNLFSRLIGIDNQYTRGDKILAWSVFIYSFGYGFLFSFVTIAVWNLISPWSNEGWSLWFFINHFIVAGLIGVVSSIWFTIGGAVDLRRLFRDLKQKEVNVLDDGRVIGHVSATDVAMVEKVDHVDLKEAHVEENILQKELEEERDQEDIDNLKKHSKE
ncbi:MAG: sodium:panthothenate symporter [Verrucomicrobiae bacterium]|nr:sodium:panthothenate symporter [Verrucomicrobiae bacterium]